MRFPAYFLDRLRSGVTLSELIGRRVALRRHGREFMGLCPFHKEKSPSFTVNNEKGFFHCFGCGAHGDAIEFLKRHEHLTYPEAVEKLAGELGVPLPEIRPEEAAREERERSLFDVMEVACAWYERQLRATAGLSARDYVTRRGLSAETAGRFRMGFAPDLREGLLTQLRGEGFADAQILEAGLAIRTDQGVMYDRFRGRLMFPIRNARGKVIAFGGRLTGESTGSRPMPKYLNSPETPLFMKGEVLFNLDQAAAPARERSEILVVEGYMDVIALDQAGIPNAVAPLGTAVTASHLKRLWAITPEPVMCLDGDRAGRAASLRAAEVALPLLMPGQSLKFALLPAGEDPDSLVRSQGNAAFQTVLRGAQPMHAVLWESIAAAYDLTTPHGRAGAEKHGNELCARIQDAATRAHWQAHFKQSLWQAARMRHAGPKSETAKKPRASAATHATLPPTRAAAQQHTCRLVLKLLIAHPYLLQQEAAEALLMRMQVQDGMDGLRQALLHVEAECDAQQLQQQLSAQGMQLLVDALLNDTRLMLPAAAMHSRAEALSCLEGLRLSMEMQEMELEYELLQQLTGAGDEAAYLRLIAVQEELRALKERQRVHMAASLYESAAG